MLEASDGPTALSLAAEAQPDVVVLDLFLPDGGGLEVCRMLKRRAPQTKVLMVTGFGHVDLQSGEGQVAVVFAQELGHFGIAVPSSKAFPVHVTLAEHILATGQEAGIHHPIPARKVGTKHRIVAQIMGG